MAAPVESAEPPPFNANGKNRMVPSAEDFTLFADKETVAKLAPALREKFAGDPALQAPGTAPNYGQWLLPHVMTLQGLVTSISRVYRVSDEALNDSFDNARFMEYDVGIRECVEARIRDSVLLDWHIDPEDELDPNQVFICSELTKIVRSIERWQQFQETLSWALWYGRNAVSLKMGWKQVSGQWYCMPTGDGSHPGWLPVHGDKLVFRLMDDRLDHPQNQVGIRVGQTYHAGDRINKLTHDTFDSRAGGEFWRVEPTDRGLAYFLDGNEAKQLVIHKYQIQDAAFERPIDAGRIHGVGIRSVLYWEWYMEKEALRWLMEFVERSAFGLELWYYPLGNEKARMDTETAIKKRVGPYRNALLVPVPPEDGGPGKQYGVDHIETGAQGADLILSIIEKYFGHRRKRYILGQILTTEAEATGLGGNLASIHLLSYRSIIRYDCKNRDETTTQFVNNLKSWNFPGNGHWLARYVTESEPVEADTKLAALQAAQSMGAPISVRQIYEAAGVTPPQPDDVIAMPAAQMAAAMGGPDGEGGGPPDDDDQGVAPEVEEGQEDTAQFSLASKYSRWAERMLGGTHKNRLRALWEGSRWNKPTIDELTAKYDDKDLRNRIALAAKTTHEKPTRGQREAGNYRKGKVSVHGIEVVIENPKGSFRKYQFEGKKGKSELFSHYGYISGTEGTDDGQLDCFIGPDPESDLVYIVDQVNPRTGEFDELKVLLGWYCTDEAKEGYLANYEKGWKGLGRLTMLTMPQFKEWLSKGNQKRSMVGQKAFYSEGSEEVTPETHGILHAMRRVEPAADKGALVTMKDLRKSLPKLPREEFDRKVMSLAKSGAISLHRHDFPSSLTDEEKSHMVFNPHDKTMGDKGSYYVGAAIRQSQYSEVTQYAVQLPDPHGQSATAGEELQRVSSPFTSKTAAERLRVGGGLRGGSERVESQHPTALGTRPLAGQPSKVKVPGQGELQVGPHPPIRAIAHQYMKEAGLEYNPPTTYVKVDKDRARRVADAYEQMEHNPEHPDTKASYEAMARETLAQYQHIKRAGLKVETIKPDQPNPYDASPRLATEDIKKNNHFWLYPTSSGYGSGQDIDTTHNPLLRDSGEVTSDGHPMLHNDVFRVVHDYFGHAKEGNGFRSDGEENAWRSHAAMYTPLARKAMTSETRGQNSWLNYGPHGEKNRTAKTEETTFAPQKTGIMPDWVMEEGRHDEPIEKYSQHVWDTDQYSEDEMIGYHSPTKGGIMGTPSTGIGSDHDIFGKGFYFATNHEYASRYGTPKAYKIKGKLASQDQWIDALKMHDKKPFAEQRAAARDHLSKQGHVGVVSKNVGVVWHQPAISEHSEETDTYSDPEQRELDGPSFSQGEWF